LLVCRGARACGLGARRFFSLLLRTLGYHAGARVFFGWPMDYLFAEQLPKRCPVPSIEPDGGLPPLLLGRSSGVAVPWAG